MNIILLIIMTIALYKPTWMDVVRFLERDHTNWQAFTADHSCEAFALDLENAAKEEGLNFYRVRVNFENGAAHIFNAIETSDHGTIYIEPQEDYRYATPKVGGYLCWNDTGTCWKADGMKITEIIEYDKVEAK